MLMFRFKERANFVLLMLITLVVFSAMVWGLSTSNLGNLNVTGNTTIRGQFLNLTIGNILVGGNITMSGSLLNVSSGNAVIANNLTVDTSTLLVDSNNNRVGIGTANPLFTLQVAGDLSMADNNITRVRCINFTSGGSLCDSL